MDNIWSDLPMLKTDKITSVLFENKIVTINHCLGQRQYFENKYKAKQNEQR